MTDQDLERRVEGVETTLTGLRHDVAELRQDHVSLRQYVVAMEQRLTAAIEQTNVHMRVLHEDLVERLANSRTSTAPRQRRPKKSPGGE